MKIIFFGDGPWAHNSLTDLIENNFNIQLVVVRFDYKDNVLIDIANKNNIDFTYHKNVNSEEFHMTIQKYNGDLAISMSFNQIIKRKTIDLFRKGFINCHAGKLPFYRGRNILNWALINDEKEIGVTCHFIDEGVDTGDIIDQDTFDITDNDTYATVLEKAIELCPRVLLKSVRKIQNDNVMPIKQPSSGTYFIARKDGDEVINWSWPSRRIFNFVRAITHPGPYAHSWIQVRGAYYKVLIKKVSLIPSSVDYICAEGAVIGKENVCPIIKSGDNSIRIDEYEILNLPKRKIRVGDRLGINLELLVTGKVKMNKILDE